ncbi:MAG: hypothetical protein KH840_04460 [Megasphaera sp.]|nr:hypothetical protein [Megasphaera sp.]
MVRFITSSLLIKKYRINITNFRDGVNACGTANVLEAESGVVDPEKVAAIQREVQITTL